MRSLRYFGMLLLLLPLSCEKMDNSGNLVPVSGQVKMDDKPLANANIIFMSVDPASGPDKYAFGHTDSDGRYSLGSNNGEGALPGNYKVLISILDRSTKAKSYQRQLIPEKYNNATTLAFSVPPEGSKKANFLDLTNR